MTAAPGVSCPSARKSGRPLGVTARRIRAAVDHLTTIYDRMTVRQVFYALEVRGIVEKTDGGYRQVQKQVLRMRQEALLPWSFIVDGTRWQRRPQTWNTVEDAMATMAATYRRRLWQSQSLRVEVWLEKDALADTIVDATTAWDVPLMVSRGQSSATFLWNAAQAAAEAWRNREIETYIFALYDRDAGGHRAAKAIATDLPAFVPEVPIHFELLGVTDEQVEQWELPTRPPKKSDPQAATFDGPAVELDAIPPDKLVTLVEDAISGLVDPRAWHFEQAVEQEERRVLKSLVEGMAA
jgi:hypothetical protein